MSVTILPSNKRSEEERKQLASFKKQLSNFNELPALIDDAMEVMGISKSSTFSQDTLSVEIIGPNRPQLTVVDLPGLIHTANRGQSSADIQMVSQLVDRFLGDRRTIVSLGISCRAGNSVKITRYFSS